MVTVVKAIARDESGATAIEYGLIAALVSVAAVAAFQDLGTALADIFGSVSSKLIEAKDSMAS